jgi:hypothetical protein
MAIYFIIYYFLTLLSLDNRFNNIFFKIIVGILLVLFIGFRHEIGGDWSSYVEHYKIINQLGLKNALIFFNNEPFEVICNWIAGYFKLGVYGTDVLYAIIFIIGLFRFASKQSNFWLIIAISFPYLITVVVMGYARQGVAIGLFLLAITFLEEKKVLLYSFFVFLAGLFHASAMFLLPLGYFLYGKKNKFLNFFFLIFIFYIGWNLILSSKIETYTYGYIEEHRQSQGGLIRVLMNVISALIFLKFRGLWKIYLKEMYKFWLILSLMSVFLFFLVFKYSTVADRLGLYLIPLQLLVFGNLPYVLKIKYKNINVISLTIFILIFYNTVEFVWLSFASHANSWIPYQNILIKGLL